MPRQARLDARPACTDLAGARLKRFRVGSITKWMDYMIRSMAVKYQ
jgi:hypothetical protein